MFFSALDECIDGMREIKKLETIANDTERQERIDKKFHELVENNSKLIKSIDIAIKKNGYTPSYDLIIMISSLLEALNNIAIRKEVKETDNRDFQNEIKKIEREMANEWEEYYKKLTSNTLKMLDTVKEISSDKDKTGYAIKKIKKGASLEETNMIYLSEGLSEAKEIIVSLGLNEEVVVFLEKVGKGSATIYDLTQPVLEWINRENMAYKLAISFK